MKENKVNYVDAALKILEKKLEDFELPTPYYMVVDGHDFEGDYCYDCGLKEYDKLRNEGNTDLALRRECSSGYISDTPTHCQECQKMLTYTLTEEGVKSELNHFDYFNDHELALNSQHECFALRAILNRYHEYEDSKEDMEKLAFRIVSSA